MCGVYISVTMPIMFVYVCVCFGICICKSLYGLCVYACNFECTGLCVCALVHACEFELVYFFISIFFSNMPPHG